MKKIIFLIAILGIINISFAQNITGYGNVRSLTEIVIPNAEISISPVTDTSIVYQYVCDKNGNYYYNFPQNGTDYIFKVTPSNQSLQFNELEENVSLTTGINDLLIHSVELKNTNGIKFTVVDTAGNPLSDAKVLIYDTKRKWRMDSCSIAKPVLTDANGQVEIKSLLPIEYWFNVKKDYLNNRFTLKNTTTAIDTNQITDIDVTIRNLTQNELYLCGLCDNKVWITDSMVIYGSSQQYDADSKLLSDGTWSDSNGRSGFWWFNSDETELTYDYDPNSSNQVTATNLTITDTSFVGDMDMSGIQITYYMSMYHDTTNFNLSVNDTIIYITPGEQITLLPEDLYLNYNYNFNYNISLSQSVFGENDVGDNNVQVTVSNRCGESATTTMHVTIILTENIKLLSKNNFKIYPNPAKNNVQLIMNNDQLGSKIEIINISGKVVMSVIARETTQFLNVSNLTKGIYFVKLITKQGVKTQKLTLE